MNTAKWILLAEDNANDADLAMRALKLHHQATNVRVVRDGREALDCLLHRGEFAACDAGRPALVLLDLKMPKVDGFEVLREIKSHAELKLIPVVIFTSSREESDITVCYQTGANAYVVKPLDFREFANALKGIGSFWLVLNEIPRNAAIANVSSRTQTGTGLAQAA